MTTEMHFTFEADGEDWVVFGPDGELMSLEATRADARLTAANMEIGYLRRSLEKLRDATA